MEATDRQFRSIFGATPYIPVIDKFEIEDKIICCDVSRLPFEAVPVNIWDQENELPQDLSVADSRHLPFLPTDEEAKAKRINELFGQVVMYERNGSSILQKTKRPSKMQLYRILYLF